MRQKLFEIKDLYQHYPVKGPKVNGEKPCVKAIDGISFDIFDGETLGLVGESGCGKTTTGRAILRLLEGTRGEILYEGENLVTKKAGEMRPLRKKMQIVFQDPYGCLDPRKTVGQIIARPLQVHAAGSAEEINARVLELMEVVGLRPEYVDRYPHEFSGGQRQRIGIARAVALNPHFIVCDEPVSALDVSIQAQVINLMQALQEKYKLTYLFISHDLRVVHHISDRVAVMYLGKIVEIADKDTLYANPTHPYTRALLSAIPEAAQTAQNKERIHLEGDIPSPLNVPGGCRFHPRCPACRDVCRTEVPPTVELEPGHLCQCHFAEEFSQA
ncbi:dipeptide ABC transporter ATP-binding protein [Ruminococcaceae bacterium OttesenSCG-928-O06]|nr:dipeptide ABC transporter ATP-binding protein [Ruminococcaceae bacterium OttesenSCG-928-O06]